MKLFIALFIFCGFYLCGSVCAVAATSAAAPSLPLSLATAEQLWLAKNRELQIARDQIAGVVADRTTAAQRPNPQLSINTSSIATGEPQSMRQADSVVRIDQTIERGDKRSLRLRGADLLIAATRADYDASQRQGRVALYNAYYDLLLAQQKFQIVVDNANLYAQTLQATQLRLRAGDIAAADVARLQVDALRGDNDRQQAQNDLRQAQLWLAYLIGAERDAVLLRATDNWPQVQSVPLDAGDNIDNLNGFNIANVFNARPDLQAAQRRVQAADAALQQALALRTRDVTVGLQVEHNGQNRPLNTVGVGISVPLLTGYEYQGEIARARADLITAQDTLDQLRAQVRGEINKTHSDYAAAAAQVTRFDNSLLTMAQRALDAVEFAYRHGATGTLDLLDARRTYKAILLDAATARANYAKAAVAWQVATGINDAPDHNANATIDDKETTQRSAAHNRADRQAVSDGNFTRAANDNPVERNSGSIDPQHAKETLIKSPLL